MLAFHPGALPTVGSAPQLEKIGHDHYVLMPVSGTEFIPAGIYYLAVISEGVGPDAGNIGVGNISATLQSKGVLPVNPVGSGAALPNATIQSSAALEGGEVKAYSFTVPRVSRVWRCGWKT